MSNHIVVVLEEGTARAKALRLLGPTPYDTKKVPPANYKFSWGLGTLLPKCMLCYVVVEHGA